ncbi:GGDEF domain-containing protein [Vibrio sp. ZSDE26]|uniref:Diguanylate cyclase DosC n=1 Tax=Vibrio amylolyticus TaxID=2847292 RepID=A0A9X2BGY3_9VIBR|nr:GGDEF domain-containing protein [Vibrio amylolyticus]MCK6263434.1 GGDEF domain-containing protein [Vibrio amylolyticus]
MDIKHSYNDAELVISQKEIDIRFSMLDLNCEKLSQLTKYDEFIQENISKIVDLFYEQQLQCDDVVKILSNEEILEHVKAFQINYIKELFQGDYGLSYANRRLKIGIVHKQIGVEPKLYITAMGQLKNIIFSMLRSHTNYSACIDDDLIILDRLFYFDSTLVLDTYINGLIDDLRTHYSEDVSIQVAKRTQYLEEQIRVDGLTNIYNKKMMEETLQKEVKLATRRNIHVSLIYIDLDNFKLINDEQGHGKGDQLLINFSSLIQSMVRETDIPCRCGGDEFCIILPDCSQDNAEQLAYRIEKEYSESYNGNTCSTGVASSTPSLPLEPKSLVQLADKNMYLNKNRKKQTKR